MLPEHPSAFLIFGTFKKADPVTNDSGGLQQRGVSSNSCAKAKDSLFWGVPTITLPLRSCFFLVFNRSGARKFRHSPIPAASERYRTPISRQPPSQSRGPLAMVPPDRETR